VDGIPLPVCHKARGYRARTFKGIAAWGFCAAEDEHYYGLKGHVMMAMSGIITAFVATPANTA
jgi:hypothetical protein